MVPHRNFLTVLTDHLAKSRDWYVELLGYGVDFDSDWFVHLQSPQNASVELGLLARSHDLVPRGYRAAPAGGMLTVVVADVDPVFKLAQARGEKVIEAPEDQFYGQRRMLVADPNGLLVDVSSECAPDPEWLDSLKG